jgi:serine/threonine-protein kinase RsbW
MPVPLILAPDLPGTARLAPWLDAEAAAGAWPEAVAFAIGLCLDEVVTNIAMHVGAPAGEILVELEQDESEIVARVTDRGPAFDPRAEQRALPTSLEEAAIGGLGLVLVQRFATALDYERQDGLNRLTLRFARVPAS